MRKIGPSRSPWKYGGFWCFCAFAAAAAVAAPRERPPATAQVIVQAGQAGCQIQLDADAAGSTDAKGSLTVDNIDPGDHYLHVLCPGKPEATYFISPKANESPQVHVQLPVAPPTDPVLMARNQAELQRLVQQAAQLRAQEHEEEAVAALRQAMKLDPQNSDLHRELGVTFLLAKDWKSARVEMIEAIRHDQSDSDAHNGLGYALEKLGDLDGAVKEYRAATNLDPDDPSYRTHYLDALVKLQARKDAGGKR